MLPQNKDLKLRARDMRKNATPQERHLWYDYLSKYPLHFYRQMIIDSYIVDFYCPKASLVVELDGSHHFTEDAKAYDEERTKLMHSLGLEVIRFTNDDVDNNFKAVCEQINKTVEQRKNHKRNVDFTYFN